MGRKMHTREDISRQKTEDLGIPDLLVLESEGDDETFYTVHKRYFKKDKLTCPACGSTKTRCSKVIKRKFKDVLWDSDDSFRIIDVYFYQRYLRCDGCKDSVFPEEIDFGQKCCRYTNRLSDVLADGTFHYSYKKVCNFFGVPASTASVGAIMRRRIQYRESLLEPIKTPKILCIIETEFYDNKYPVVLAIWNKEVYCLDILEDTTEGAYISFFKTLNADYVETVCIDPEENLRSAVATCFPMASVVMTEECVFRYARNAMLNIIRSDGKRFPIRHKDDQLTLHKKYLTDARVKKQIKDSMKSRPRLQTAYEKHQNLLELLETDWTYEDLVVWANEVPVELNEFADLIDLIDIYKTELKAYLDDERQLPEKYITSVQAVCDAFKNMPRCIFDVLRARSILTPGFDTIEEDGQKKRQGIRYDRLTANMNQITENIKEEREYGLER